MQMFVGIPETPQNIVTTPTAVKDNVDWAIRVLQKSDRIVWYLRLYKLYLLKQSWLGALQSAQKMLHHESDTMQRAQAHENALALEAAYKRELAKYAKKSEVPADRVEAMAMRVTVTDDFRTSAEHFFSLDIAAIRDYIFGWKTWAVIIADLERIEDAWKKKQARFIPIQREGVETVIRFSDKSEWINLNKSSCDIEAKAMGHCGNTAGYTGNDTILTYRTIEKDPKTKQTVWVPHLTFILNTVTGMLGEMKGFNNQHPDQKYHNVIIELLKLPLIKGIVGGGYKPENNFMIKDLPEETTKQMMEFKPALGTLTDHYAMTGLVDHEMFTKIEAIADDHGLSVSDFDHNAEEKIFYIDQNVGDIDDVYRNYGSGGLDTDPHVDDSQVKEFFNDMSDKTRDSLYYYMKTVYDKSPRTPDDLYDMLKEEDDDELLVKIEEIMKQLHVEGIRQEAESWLDQPGDESVAYFHFEREKGGEKGKWQLLSNEDDFMEKILPKIGSLSGSHNSWLSVTGNMLPDPNEYYSDSFAYGDMEWFYEDVEQQFLDDDEVSKIIMPTPEEAGQLRLFKDEEKRSEEEKKQMHQRLAAST